MEGGSRSHSGSGDHEFNGYDIVGDVHGCATALANLLEKMGYRKQAGVYRHRERQAIFVGDVVDRGPHIRQALSMVRDMVEAGAAQLLMGNHEYNLYCYATPDPRRRAMAYLREHNPHNDRLVAETMAEFAAYPAELRDYLDWFGHLPLFLDFPAFRVVHACWDPVYIHQYLSRYESHCVSPEIIVASSDSASFAARALDRLLRGTSIRLPEGQKIVSRDGYERQYFRTSFWAGEASTYGDVVYQPDPLPNQLLGKALNDAEKAALIHYGEDQKPLFFGHYWLQGKPAPVRNNLACLDYSAVKFGRLVAYRYDFEAVLSPKKYVWVYVDPQ